MILNILSRRQSSRKLTLGQQRLTDIQQSKFRLYQSICRSLQVGSALFVRTECCRSADKPALGPRNVICGNRPLPLLLPRRSLKRLTLDEVQTRRTLYDILGINSKATAAEIKSAYYKLSMTFHPDTNKDLGAVGKFREVTEAYEILGNASSRRRYDKGLLRVVGGSSTIYTSTYYPEDHAESVSVHTPAESRFKTRVQPYQGRTSAYNFDEWTKAHYGKTFNRAAQAKREYAKEEAEMEMAKRAAGNQNFMILVVMIVTFAALVLTNLTLTSNDNPRKQSRPD